MTRCGTGKNAQEPRVVLHDALSDQWREFSAPLACYSTSDLCDVVPLLEELEARVEREQLYAAGFISYEAAPAFDPTLPARTDAEFPLIWFGLFSSVQVCPAPVPVEQVAAALDWCPESSSSAYDAALRNIRAAIQSGETYQVNYTYRMRMKQQVDSWALFCELAGEVPFAAYVQTGAWSICSFSPELFFQREGTHLTSRPMKGTRPRGVTVEADLAYCDALVHSEKERAENVMIVDMVRNDFGRIARPGSVQVPSLFTPEKYPTVWQLTSTVEAQSEVSTVAVLQALFPPASITGAPKRRTMQMIRELEQSPRRIYTGCIGYLAPGQRAQFNVAIRTVLLNTEQGCGEYGVGGGIVWDSNATAEYAETLTKSRALRPYPRDFALLETLRWDPAEGYWLEALHLDRLARSAAYFGIPLDVAAVKAVLQRAVHAARECLRVRLTVARDGAVHVTCVAAATAATFGRVALAKSPIERHNVFLYHKTTHRAMYQQALAECPGADDVVLFNETGEVTESTIANLAVQLNGTLYTPPLSCGLLAGTLRAALLQEGRLTERVIRVDELAQCEAIYFLNAVRGLQRITLSQLDQ